MDCNLGPNCALYKKVEDNRPYFFCQNFFLNFLIQCMAGSQIAICHRVTISPVFFFRFGPLKSKISDKNLLDNYPLSILTILARKILKSQFLFGSKIIQFVRMQNILELEQVLPISIRLAYSTNKPLLISTYCVPSCLIV